MRLSGARPKRTWNAVVSSSATASTAKVDADGAVEAARLVVDLGGVAGDRDQKAAVVAEIDVALDQAQPLVLGALHIALRGIRRQPADALVGEMRQARIPQRARGTHLGLCAYRAA